MNTRTIYMIRDKGTGSYVMLTPFGSGTALELGSFKYGNMWTEDDSYKAYNLVARTTRLQLYDFPSDRFVKTDLEVVTFEIKG